MDHIERESHSRDVSQEFLSMEPTEFFDFLDTMGDESALSITVDWQSADHAKLLKAFLESRESGQRRSATIRATEDEYGQALNVFASGVKWERVEKDH